MKKLNRILMLLFMVILVGCGNNENNTVHEIDYSVMWKGIVYSGKYEGEFLNGVPSGKGIFKGYEMTEENNSNNVILYNGDWIDGKFYGEGTLTDESLQKEYKGKFINNRRTSSFVVTDLETKCYEKISYMADIPYGILVKYDQDGKYQEYDRYYLGNSVRELMDHALDIPYVQLLYDSDNAKYRFIKVDCKVVDVNYEIVKKELNVDNETESIFYYNVKAGDGKNNYILKYICDYKNSPENYMPVLEKGDMLTVYGYANGISYYFGDENQNMVYPVIEAVTARKKEKPEFDYENPTFSYDVFCDFPYELKNKPVQIKGTVSGVEIDSDNNVYCQVDSDAYTDGIMKKYVCQYSGDANDIPLVGDEIQVDGILKLAKRYILNDKIAVYPKIYVNNSIKGEHDERENAKKN